MPTLPSSYSDLQTYTDHLCDFITSPLVRQITGGIHVNDALIYNAWENLPQEWTDWWSIWPDHRLAQQDLIRSIDEEVEPESGAPEKQPLPTQSRPKSLDDWLRTMKSLALPRSQHPGPTISLPEALTARMKPKKIAEISRAVAYVQGICQSKGIDRVIDMGSGQGYLSISLAYLFPHLRILSIDGSESQLAGSQSFATSLGIEESRLKHVHHWIDGSSSLAAEIQDWADGEKCMLVGLHACGSLSEHMLRYFTTVPCIEALAVVGCCYNHIVPRSASCPDGFPISSALRKNNLKLSPTSLMIGCQAPSNWRNPDQKGDIEERSIFGRRRLYRAIMEKILFDKEINVNATTDKPVWGTRKGDLINFTKYARRAMDCLNIDYEKIPTEELVAYEEQYSGYEGRIAILWTLGVLCCKIVESVVAMDRYWFLKEQRAHGVDIIPIFNFGVSPRNLMIVAEKVPKLNDKSRTF